MQLREILIRDVDEPKLEIDRGAIGVEGTKTTSTNPKPLLIDLQRPQRCFYFIIIRKELIGHHRTRTRAVCAAFWHVGTEPFVHVIFDHRLAVLPLSLTVTVAVGPRRLFSQCAVM
uniref:Uncharacterized protein n=1 Tax=Steinernema glaseri TaxID=37863 RepID=A0A1I7ZKX8_9BILA